MKGDFTRNSLDLNNLFNRVLMQQGRVTLDADFNEQVDILLYYLQNLARDLIGPYARPRDNPGFMLSEDNDAILITAGRYYVDGILVENKKLCSYSNQPYYQVPDNDPLLKIFEAKDPDQWFWLYLDVWERHVTSIESEDIREKALGGPDTCTRSQYVWQVKALPVKPDQLAYKPYAYPHGYPYPYGDQLRYPYGQTRMDCTGPLGGLVEVSKVQLAARVDPDKKDLDACITSPDAKYVGVENHLYRVEIHRGGSVGTATFKWSRDNGSVVTPWLDTKSSGGNNELVVTSTRGFSGGGWVELTDENDDLNERHGILVRVAKVGSGVLSLDSASIPGEGLPDRSKLVHPKVRRWDQTQKGDIQLDNGAVKVDETPIGATPNNVKWIDLEDGIQIAFSQMPFGGGAQYRTGDYWLIPARVATGSIEWPAAEAQKLSLVAPRGVVHHYAPLAFVNWENDAVNFQPCLCEFEPISECPGTAKGFPAFGEEHLVAAHDVFPEHETEEKTDVTILSGQAVTPARKAVKRPRTKKKPQ